LYMFKLENENQKSRKHFNRRYKNILPLISILPIIQEKKYTAYLVLKG
jgi:hypothetical protein